MNKNTNKLFPLPTLAILFFWEKDLIRVVEKLIFSITKLVKIEIKIIPLLSPFFFSFFFLLISLCIKHGFMCVCSCVYVWMCMPWSVYRSQRANLSVGLCLNFYIQTLATLLDFIKETLLDYRSHIDSNTLIVGDLHTSSPTDRPSRQKTK